MTKIRLMKSPTTWIWQRPGWPNFSYDYQSLANDLSEAHYKFGAISGLALGIDQAGSQEIAVDVMTSETLATAAIEGEQLSMDAVRSSVMRRMGVPSSGPRDRDVDGLVAVLSDATASYADPLTEDRLCRWHSSLFPGGTSGLMRIAVGRYRENEEPMQIVSGAIGHEVVHYEAPPSSHVSRDMQFFLSWFEATKPGREAKGGQEIDGLVRAAMAHLWFESIHPFEDGNGRIGRAIVDLALAQMLQQPVRFVSISCRLEAVRDDYYDQLNSAQRGALDVTPWIKWFARQSVDACEFAQSAFNQAIEKRRYWHSHRAADLNDRQRKVLQRLLDAGNGGFVGGLNAEKYMTMTSASKATATRDLSALVAGGQVWTTGQGKGLRYHVNVPGWTHDVDHDLDALRLLSAAKARSHRPK